MIVKCLQIKVLSPPLAGGGLWRMCYLLLSASIRHHPPSSFGGAKSCVAKDLNDIRHLRAAREGDDIICGGLRKKTGLRKIFTKTLVFMIDVHQLQYYTIIYDNETDKKRN